jgi:hypothetical protein
MEPKINKVCKKCNMEKDIEFFSTEKGSHGKYYTRNTCKQCKNKQVNIETQRARHRRYGKNNRSKITARERNRVKIDINYYLTRKLRTRIRAAVKNNQKMGSAVSDLGCSIIEFKEYLESKFLLGMTWENRSEWHLDHIKPLSSFDLTSREQFLTACHYTNLQPLWAKDNIQKGSKDVTSK